MNARRVLEANTESLKTLAGSPEKEARADCPYPKIESGFIADK
jgi:hypothetical protein